MKNSRYLKIYLIFSIIFLIIIFLIIPFSMVDTTLFQPVEVSIANHRYNANASVTMTLDDGFLGDVKAEMLFKKYNVRGTSFLIVVGVRGGANELYLNETQTIDLYNSGVIDISSHTYTHTHITDSGVDLVRELNESKNYFENLLNKKVTGFAYPYGSDGQYDIVMDTYFFARDTDYHKIEYPIAENDLKWINVSAWGDEPLEKQKSVFDSAYRNKGFYRHADHSGGIHGTWWWRGTIEDSNRWGNYSALLAYISNKSNVYYGSMEDIIEYQKLRAATTITGQMYNSTLKVFSFNVNSSISSSDGRYKVPLTILVKFNNTIQIAVDDNINVAIDGVRAPVKIVDQVNRIFWFEVPRGNHSIQIKNGTTSFTIDLTRPIISNVYSDGQIISWTTNQPSDSIVYYTNNSSLPIWKWYILARNTSKTTSHSISIPPIDYLGLNTIKQNDTIYYIVASTNQRGMSGWNDNNGNYYITKKTPTPPTPTPTPTPKPEEKKPEEPKPA